MDAIENRGMPYGSKLRCLSLPSLLSFFFCVIYLKPRLSLRFLACFGIELTKRTYEGDYVLGTGSRLNK